MNVWLFIYCSWHWQPDFSLAMSAQGNAQRTGNPEIDLPKARSLGNALLAFLLVPWSFCLVLYTGSHLTVRSIAFCDLGSEGRSCPVQLTRLITSSNDRN